MAVLMRPLLTFVAGIALGAAGMLGATSAQQAGTAVPCTGSRAGTVLTITCDEAATWTSTPTSTPTAPASFTPTNTATMTPSPSPSATATPLATAAPTSSSTATTNSIAQIIADSDERTPHDGVICGTAGYSWEKTSDVQSATPGGFPTGTGWGVLNWNCGSNVAGVTVTIQNWQAWVLVNGRWTQVNNRVTWCETLNPQTNVFMGPGCGGLGPTWSMPNASYSVHWASDHNSIVNSASACAWTAYQARYAGPAGAYIMADAGFDWWSGSSIRGAIVGRYHRLTTSWQWINASTCTPAQLTAHPPPF